MARPKNAVPSKRYRVTLTLQPGIDQDLIDYLDAADNQALAIVTAMRAGGMGAVASGEDLDEEGLLDSFDDFLID